MLEFSHVKEIPNIQHLTDLSRNHMDRASEANHIQCADFHTSEEDGGTQTCCRH